LNVELGFYTNGDEMADDFEYPAEYVRLDKWRVAWLKALYAAKEQKQIDYISHRCRMANNRVGRFLKRWREENLPVGHWARQNT
jgi:hypothetical protein